MRSEPVRVKHGFPPVYDGNSKVLVLGSMPSPKSRERGFYYMHPQNRFWRMLAEVLGEELPADIPGRRDMCISHGVALWDVLAECTISGASDSSITDPVPNPLEEVFRAADIRAVFTTGKKAQALYERFFPGLPPAVCLPSTSPANRTISEERMLAEYRRIATALESQI